MLTSEQQTFLDEYFPAKPLGEEPHYSCYGYLITEDGTVRSIFKQYWHGVGLTLLFPEYAKEQGFQIPASVEDVEDYERKCDSGFPRRGVFAYQDFEIDHRRELPVLVVGYSFAAGLRVCKGCNPCNENQAAALRAVFHSQSLRARDTVITDSIDMPMCKAIDYLMTGDLGPALEDDRDDYDD